MNRLTRLERVNQLLTPKNMVLFIRIMISIPIFHFLVKRVEMPDLLRRLDNRSPFRKPFKEKDLERAELGFRYANLFLVTCLRVKNPCLLRSLILFHILREKGLDAKIHFGIKRGVSPLTGHSWLSLDGKNLFEGLDPQLAHIDMYSYPHDPT